MKDRVERSARKADRLEARNDALDDVLKRERSDRERVLAVLHDAVDAAAKPKKRRGRVLWLLVIAGAAYTFGARAGRERYEQIVSWAKQVRSGVRDSADTAKSELAAQDSASPA